MSVECRAAFDLCDKNHDKSISTKELIVALRKLGLEPSEKEVKKIIKEVDRNSDDRIDFNEFLLMVKKKHEISEIVQSFVKLFQVTSQFTEKKSPQVFEYSSEKTSFFTNGEKGNLFKIRSL